MTIMVAGGLTFAIPGMEPAEAAQISSNPHLKVSAEGQNAANEIAATNIVEVVVIDDLTDTDANRPIVRVDGTILPMYFFSGGWYGYFADNDILGAGLGVDTEAAVDTLVTESVLQAATDDNLGAVTTPADVVVLVLSLDGEFDVTYERAGGAETVTLEADDPDSGVSLDRTTYPRNTGVVITIDDQALNVDPTSEDSWYFSDGGASSYSTLESVQAVLTAATTRDTAIDEARTAMTTAIPEDPAIAEDASITDLRKKFAALDILLANPLTDPTDTDVAELIGQYGQGDRDNDESSVDQSGYENYKGTDLITHQGLYGDPQGATDDLRKGTAQTLYEGAAGRGDRNENAETSPDYKGTALIAFERVAGNGQMNITPDPELGGSDVPANYRGSAWITYDAAVVAANVPDTGVGGVESFGLTKGTVLECATDGCIPIGDDTWVKFTEDGDNDSNFNNAPGDEPNMKTTSSAPRGLSFSVEYDNTVTPGIGYSTTNIVIDAGDEWNSGQEIGITLTDSDANTNSLSGDDLSIANVAHKLPLIEFGDPYTLLGTPAITAYGPNNDRDAPDLDTELDVTITTSNDDTSKRLVLGGNVDAAAHTLLVIDLGTIGELGIEDSDRVTHVANFDVSALGDGAVAKINYGGPIPDSPVLGTGEGNDVLDTTDESARDNVKLVIHILDEDVTIDDSPIVFDIFSFGLDASDDNVNDAIYRLELEEDGDDSSDFVGTLEYIGLNQYNILNPSTYGGIDATGDSIILISDDDSVSVEYLDLDATGDDTLFTAEADTPTHSGSVSLDSDGYKVADTVMVTVEDADLNVDSAKADVYTTFNDKIDSALGVPETPVLTVLINDKEWVEGCNIEDGSDGLDDSQFTLRETGSDSGVFTGTFAVPAEYCHNGSAATVTGTDISVDYLDFRDDSGSTITVSASAGIRSNTGSVSLDRTVYPVPIGADAFETFGETEDETILYLDENTLQVYVSINDPDFDTQSNGIDNISEDLVGDDVPPLVITVLRGSDELVVGYAGHSDDYVVRDADGEVVKTYDANPISETASDSGIFEHTQELTYTNGPDSRDCPTDMDGCILQGDILHVQYEDPSDASGSKNTVTDSATFDLRNGVLQVDKPGTTGYVIGSDMIVTLIEPDFNLDSDATETYILELIEWDSSAGTTTLKDGVFDATPSNLLETGTNTGIFQVVLTVPPEIDNTSLERGEEITLTYNDWGPSGSDYVGDKDEEITTIAYTSDFGASIELDQKVYTWTDKVYITIVAPDHNFDADQVDEIGSDDTPYPINIKTQEDDIEGYKLVETGADTGIFSGELILTGVDNDDLDRETERSSGDGPTDGRLAAEDSDGLAIVFENSDGDIVRASAIIQWNVGEVEWLEASYPALGSGIVRVIDPDMNLNPEAVDNFEVNVWSDSDVGGIKLTVTETNAATGIFEGTVFFDDDSISSGHRLNVEEGDTVVAEYDDVTSPIEDETSVSATTLIGTIVPPLERAPINNLRAVDTFDNSIGAASVGQQVVITADLSNGQDRDQDFIFLIQVQDENGVTVSLNWVLGTLAADQSFSPGASWTPTDAGTYDVTAFVWESIDNPTALSPTATIALTVN